jgi:hypothetical protein
MEPIRNSPVRVHRPQVVFVIRLCVQLLTMLSSAVLFRSGCYKLFLEIFCKACRKDTCCAYYNNFNATSLQVYGQVDIYILCSEDENAIHILLKCLETRKWREEFLSRNWLILNEWIAYKKIINCINIIELRHKGSYLYKIKCKWENKIRNLSSEVGVEL